MDEQARELILLAISQVSTWGTLCPDAAVRTSLCFGFEKRENSSQERFPANGLLGENHECASGSIPPGNKDHIQSEVVRAWVSAVTVCLREGDSFRTRGRDAGEHWSSCI